jgi:hypothetical protein
MSKNYWINPLPLNDNCKKFGYFIGRRTVSRAKILYDLWHNYQDQCLFSVMHSCSVPPWVQPSQGISLETLVEWVDLSLQKNFSDWFANCPVSSIDGHSDRDQYVKNPTTNLDLLQYYNQFAVEIVAETYTLGNTFFPTEKTIRPIMAAKPMLIYGPKNFLARLRQLGFKTYESCWDESYDQLEGPARWQAMQLILSQIKFSSCAHDIALYNRETLAKIIQL